MLGLTFFTLSSKITLQLQLWNKKLVDLSILLNHKKKVEDVLEYSFIFGPSLLRPYCPPRLRETRPTTIFKNLITVPSNLKTDLMK